MPLQLSGGQQQRVAIARSLVNNPKLIFADEPTGALDSETSTDIMNLLKDLNNQGKTIIMVTHDADLIKYATKVIRLKDGVLYEEGNYEYN
jgi:putative ABC transport system ATP-binding protein